MCVCVCVCVCEREREREKETIMSVHGSKSIIIERRQRQYLTSIMIQNVEESRALVYTTYIATRIAI